MEEKKEISSIFGILANAMQPRDNKTNPKVKHYNRNSHVATTMECCTQPKRTWREKNKVNLPLRYTCMCFKFHSSSKQNTYNKNKVKLQTKQKMKSDSPTWLNNSFVLTLSTLQLLVFTHHWSSMVFLPTFSLNPLCLASLYFSPFSP